MSITVIVFILLAVLAIGIKVRRGTFFRWSDKKDLRSRPMDRMATVTSGNREPAPTFIGGDEVSAVRLREVHKSFGSVQAVRGVDLTIRSGRDHGVPRTQRCGEDVDDRHHPWVCPNRTRAKSRSMA